MIKEKKYVKPLEPENMVTASFAYHIAKMFQADAEFYRKLCEKLEGKLKHYKQQSIY